MARYLRDLEMRDPTPEELEQKRVERHRAHEEELEFSNGIEAHPPGRRGGPCPLCAQKDKEIAKLQAEISARLQYESFLRSCIRSGEKTEMMFDEFVRQGV